MGIKIQKGYFGIVHQGRKSQFYFQIDNMNKYFLHYALTAKIDCGVYTGTNLEYGPDIWNERKMVGLFFDITISVFRFGIYLHPICYSKR